MPDNNQKIKVILADNKIALKQITHFLSKILWIEIVAATSDPDEVLNFILSLKPDLIICGIDSVVCSKNHFEIIAEIKTHWPAIRIISLSMLDSVPLKEAALKIGVDHFISRENIIKELIPAIHTYFEGNK